MKNRMTVGLCALIAAGLTTGASAEPFTYQGQLMEAGAPADGLYDMTFTLTDSASGGFALAVDSISNVSVVDGIFSVEIDFPSALLNDDARWLSINVEGSILSPRTRVRPTPRALNAVRANAAGTVELPLFLTDSSSVPLEVEATSSTGTAIRGIHAATTGTTPGIHGESNSRSANAVGVYGEITANGAGGLSAGVRGRNRGQSTLGIGVYGSHDAGGWGVYGTAPSGRGVRGSSTSGTGIDGVSTSGTGVNGVSNSGTGVYSQTSSGSGLYAIHNDAGTNVTLANAQYAVEAFNTSLTGNGIAIFGSGRETGIEGVAEEDGNGNRVGVRGIAGSSNATGSFIAGVRGYALTSNSSNRTGYGVYGSASASTSSDTAYGVYGTAFGDGTRWAGYFTGDVHVTGTLSKSSGSFKIDHPLDPENKYLSHSFVESPDMMNIYNGVILLDTDGNAVVELPDYFEVLNRDFRYQLTPIGASMPNLYIASEISTNQFMISGGVPNAKVSWEVTGVRQDPSSNLHRIQVEEDKPEQHMGKYLDPEAFGFGNDRAMHPQPELNEAF